MGDRSQLTSVAPWTRPTLEELGIPKVPLSAMADVPGNPIGWCPGIKVDAPGVDWYIIQWHTGNIRHYLSKGGDPKKMIVHFLSHDEGVIDPMWGGLDDRVKRMREFGVHTLIGVDFSAWADSPIAFQIFCIYKTAIVNRDLARHGFKLIPQPNWSVPQIHHLQMDFWPAEAKYWLVDGHHLGTNGAIRFNTSIFWPGARTARDRWAQADPPWFWSSTPKYAALWKQVIGPCRWVPTRSRMLGSTIKVATRLKRQQQLAGTAGQ